MLLALLPFFCFIGLFLILSNRFPSWGWRLACLRTAIIVTVYAVGVTEVLSLINSITRTVLIIIWGFPTLLAGGYLLKKTFQQERLDLWSLNPPSSGHDRLLLIVILVVLGITATVAWFSPPNTWDSLTTHMSRVAHWAQDRSIGHYATGVEFQNYYPPLPGIAILQTYLLAGNDQFANLSQWSAMVISLIGTSLIAKNLGASRSGQLLAGTFTVTLPMGIAQATSTMTDYIVAVSMVFVVSEIFQLLKGKDDKSAIAFLSISTGLAIMSKPIAFAYLLPFGLMTSLILIQRYKLRKILLVAVLAIAIVVILNAGYLSRNINTYSNPIGANETVANHTNDVQGWRVLVSNLLRNASLHASTPFPELNNLLYETLYKVHVKLGLGLSDQRTSIHSVFNITKPSTDEARSGNTLHAIIILIACLLLIVYRKKASSWILLYSIMVIASFILVSYFFKFTIFGSRYHTAFFVLFSPLVGYFFSLSWPQFVSSSLGIIMLIASWPWLSTIESRPLIPDDARTQLSSVLRTPREILYLGSNESFEKYFEITEQIMNNKCTSVFVMLSSSQPEYPFWVYLGAPQSSVQIEWNVAGTRSEKFAKPSFIPCAVICDATCDSSWTTIRGLPLHFENSSFRLFLDN